MHVRIAAIVAGFALIAGFSALPEARAAEPVPACDRPWAPASCGVPIDPVETGAIGTHDEVGLLLNNSELVLPGMTLRIHRPLKLRRANAVL